MTPIRLLPALLAAALLLPAVARAEPVVLSTGHTDAVDVGWVDGAFDVAVKDDTGAQPVQRDPADVIFHAKPESELVIPEGLPPAFAFLGRAGESSWILPQTQDPELLWPGWETMRFPAGVLAGDRMAIRLVDVDGPGGLHVYTTTLGQPEILLDGTDLSPGTLDVPINTHAHANWAFGATGLYTLWFEATGTRLDGRRVTSGPVRYRFFVGDLADLPELPETTVTVGGLRPAYTAGETVTLTATQAPDTGLTDLDWSSSCGGAPFTPAGDGAVLRFTATAAHDGCRYRAALRAAGGALVARSEPVTLSVRPVPRPAPPRAVPLPGPGAVLAPEARRITLAASRARLRGRTLRLTLRLGTGSTVRVWVRRGGRIVARAKPRMLATGRHHLRLRLPRALRPGRYRVQVRARAGRQLVTRTLTVRVRR
jgi:surface-anchored protein